MNPRPISSARDPDLRLSLIALRRAAQRARELAVQTGTDIVISRGGVLQIVSPQSTESTAEAVAQDPRSPYGGQP